MVEFKKEFVNVVWTDELIGKECWVADAITNLIKYVTQEKTRQKIVGPSSNPDYPFATEGSYYQFCYYDPDICNATCAEDWRVGDVLVNEEMREEALITQYNGSIESTWYVNGHWHSQKELLEQGWRKKNVGVD